MAQPSGWAGRGSLVAEAPSAGIVVLPRASRRERVSAADRWRSIAQVVLDLTAIRDPDDLLKSVVRAVRLLTDADASAVLVPDPGSPERYRFVLDDDDRGARLIRDLVGTDGLAILAAPSPRSRHLDVALPGTAGAHEVLAIGIENQGVLYGTLVLVGGPDGPSLDGEAEAMARTLAAQAAVSLDNTRAHARALALVRELDEANDALRQASEARSRMLANVAHEIRTPLHSILLAARVLREPATARLDRDRTRTLPVTIEDGARHLLALLDDLVDLSRAEISDLRLRVVDTDLAPLLADVRRQVRPLAVAKDIRIRFAEARGVRVAADPVRLRQVLLNLLSNAVKFTPPGGRVRVTVTESAGMVQLRVRDTGSGIAAEDIERAFEPFDRLGRDDVPGGGLGLAIARRIVELHGGRLTVTSLPGPGATFEATIPLAADAKVVRDLVPAGPPSEPVPVAVGTLA
jgi:signal transduction histidine kinase